MTRQALVLGRLGRGYVEMAKLYLRLSPRESGRAREGIGILVFVNDVEQRRARRCRNRPEGDSGGTAWKYPQAYTQCKHRIEDRAHRAGQGPAVSCGHGIADFVAAAEKAGTVSLDLDFADGLAFDRSQMGSPKFGLVGVAASPRRQDGADSGQILGVHEELGKGLMGCIGRRRCQNDFSIGCDLDSARSGAGICQRDTSHLRIVFRRYENVEGCDERAVVPHKLRAIFGKHYVVTIGPHAGRLMGGRPYCTAVDVAQEDVAAGVVSRRVLAPSRHGMTSPFAIAGTGGRQHHRVTPVR